MYETNFNDKILKTKFHFYSVIFSNQKHTNIKKTDFKIVLKLLTVFFFPR